MTVLEFVIFCLIFSVILGITYGSGGTFPYLKELYILFFCSLIICIIRRR
jgi:hypothetical protein